MRCLYDNALTYRAKEKVIKNYETIIEALKRVTIILRILYITQYNSLK